MTFTSQLPTVPGFYAWKHDEESPSVLIHLELFDGRLDFPFEVKFRGCLWSSLLVPVEEVEKAYKEGFMTSEEAQECLTPCWNSSHAKQIVDGTKGKESGE